jgi:hypothetical protein
MQTLERKRGKVLRSPHCDDIWKETLAAVNHTHMLIAVKGERHSEATINGVKQKE